jgi:hypothetical protein
MLITEQIVLTYYTEVFEKNIILRHQQIRVKAGGTQIFKTRGDA